MEESGETVRMEQPALSLDDIHRLIGQMQLEYSLQVQKLQKRVTELEALLAKKDAAEE